MHRGMVIIALALLAVIKASGEGGVYPVSAACRWFDWGMSMSASEYAGCVAWLPLSRPTMPTNVCNVAGDRQAWNTPTADTRPTFALDGGGSYSFDATDDYWRSPQTTLLDSCTGMTAMAWVKITTYATCAIFESRGTSSNRHGLVYIGASGGLIRGYLCALYIGATWPGTNQWHHAAWTWNTGQPQTLYVNGLQVAQSAVLHWAPAVNDVWQIGAEDAALLLGGNIKDVRLFSFGLNSNQVWKAAQQKPPQ